LSESSSGEKVEKSGEGEASSLRELRVLAPIGEERIGRQTEAIKEGAELLGETRRAGELKGSGRSEKEGSHKKRSEEETKRRPPP